MQRDKVLHVIAGVCAAVLACGLVELRQLVGMPAVAFAAGVIVGFAKEIDDFASGNGVADWADLLATVAGAAAVAAVIHFVGAV